MKKNNMGGGVCCTKNIIKKHTLELNSKGFAISSIMYLILLICIILITLTLAVLSNRNLILNKQKSQAMENILYNKVNEVCIPVNAETVTRGSNGNPIGKIPQGKYEPGDEYICNVDGVNYYRFYILSIEEDKVNLIMSRNICSDGTLATIERKCLIPWISKDDYKDDANYGANGNNNKGPVTAMNYLYEATKNWRNVEDIYMNYTDEGNSGSYGYGGITTSGTTTKITMKNGTVIIKYNNLKARLPKGAEIEATGCASTLGSCPVWLVNGLSTKTDYYPQGTKVDISGIYAYWSLSSEVSSSRYVRYVNYYGRYFYNDININSYSGIRPVIQVPKNKIKKI